MVDEVKYSLSHGELRTMAKTQRQLESHISVLRNGGDLVLAFVRTPCRRRVRAVVSRRRNLNPAHTPTSPWTRSTAKCRCRSGETLTETSLIQWRRSLLASQLNSHARLCMRIFEGRGRFTGRRWLRRG